MWNRSSDRADPLRALGAQVAQCVAEVFDRGPVVILMLANAAAIDTVLGRGTRNSLVERTRATFTASLEGIRQHPPDTISSGFFALMTLDEWCPHRWSRRW